ncbi:hypothetical protein CYLTODRAFT_423998 [Cylindrobasidium torrendii FP15055 ss-10]|uniref:DUF6534 domain-containing protein n=1 Tax=Cylindrobasidium torrendii FP15055 ss-10 TaxID=1314674 RepID=A0A0D7B8G3_9AGAR|nr:hypothetical protein CYLTODRAFT_423998 [Cylindrobasidium torrendii FP15055 ss-10]
MDSHPPPNSTGHMGPAPNPAIDPTLHMSFDSTLGALLIGGLLAMALWGISGIQTFAFFYNNTRDRRGLKALIGFLYIADTFHSALCCHLLYHYLIKGFTNIHSTLIPVWSVNLLVVVTSVVDFIVRGLFTKRLYRLSGNRALAILIVVLSFADLVVGIYITARAFRLTTYLELEVISNLFYLNFACGTSSDILVSLGLTYYLLHSRTSVKKTNSLISTLLVYTINTGLIVAIDAALGVILFAAMPGNFIFLTPYVWLSKLYLNSYLASLNAREALRERNADVSIRFNTAIEFSPSASEPPTPLSSTLLRSEKRHSSDIGTSLSSSSRDVEMERLRDEGASKRFSRI